MKTIITLLIDTIISLFFIKNKLQKSIVITSTQNESFNFNSKYLFEHLIKNTDNVVYYIINNEKKRNELNKLYPNHHFLNTNLLRHKIIVLKSKFWISSTFELPLTSLINNKNRICLHLGHGIPLKKIGFMENNITIPQYINRKIRTRIFTHIICYSDFFEPYLRKSFKNKKATYLKLGQPRNDYLVMDNEQGITLLAQCTGITESELNNKVLILYSPTWRNYSDTELFPFPDYNFGKLNHYLKKNNTIIFIRPHPFYPVIFPSEFHFNENIIDLSSDVIVDISEILSIFDMLLTDYSSIYLDYLIVDKKIGFIPYDFNTYEKNIGFTIDYNTFTPGDKILSQNELLEFITGTDHFSEKRKNIRSIINLKDNNCGDIAHFISHNYKNKPKEY